MIKVKKQVTANFQAYRLGTNTEEEIKLVQQGKIKRLVNGKYELLSQEAINGRGQIAEKGDYFKVDSRGFPYPIKRDVFEKKYQRNSENCYQGKSEVLLAWMASDEMSDEIAYLIQHKGLVLKPDDPDRFFNAPLWGSDLSAAVDAVLIFYEIKYNSKGEIEDVDFNFVERKEFERNYIVL